MGSMKNHVRLALLFTLLCLTVYVVVWSLSDKLSSYRFRPLKRDVSVVWDQAGVPHIQAQSIEDGYFVQGFVTARDRFFQMDLARRKMDGTLTELFGAKALESDIKARKWNYREAARKSFHAMSSLSKERLNIFTEGVNAFLQSSSRPWEYFFIRARPEPWRAEDSFLIVLSMYDSLNHHDSPSEQAYLILKSKTNSKVLDFLTAEWGFLDAPTIEDLAIPKNLPSPSAEDFKIASDFSFDQLPNQFKSIDKKTLKENLDKEPGSNAWVISGKHSASGKPILASDPHLDLRVPNLWYRIELSLPDFNVRGATIPGIPGVVIGRNQNLAWAFTNSAVDNSDRILIHPSSPLITKREETFFLRDGTIHKEVFHDSPWGPVFSQPDADPFAVLWTALDSENLKTLDLTDINKARGRQELLTAFQSWAGPIQNMVFATAEGDIGWTLVGKIPLRMGFDGKTPLDFGQEPIWKGYVPFSQVPQVLNPEGGHIVNANQRTVPVNDKYLPFGHHWPNPARARRITNRIKEAPDLNVSEMASIQNDNVSLTHLYYRDELSKCLKSDPSGEALKFTNTLSAWTGKTDLNSRVFSFLREFRFELIKTLIAPIAWTLSSEKVHLLFRELSRDELVKRILDSKAPHLLAPQFYQTCDALVFALKNTLSSFSATTIDEIPVWGSVNLSTIEHPFSKVLPQWLKSFINFPKMPLAGDYLVPRVMTPSNGASMRMVVDLGDPQKSVFSQPGGQSGNPLSSHYQDLFTGWVKGETVPFEATIPSREEVFLSSD